MRSMPFHGMGFSSDARDPSRALRPHEHRLQRTHEIVHIRFTATALARFRACRRAAKAHAKAEGRTAAAASAWLRRKGHSRVQHDLQ